MSQTLVKAQLEPFDLEVWTACDIVGPAIALVQREPSLLVLLAKDSAVARDHTHLGAVRAIPIPQGPALWFLRLRARLWSAHLPDETLYNNVELVRLGQHWRARTPAGFTLGRPSRQPFPLQTLTRSQYLELAEMPGRQFIERLAALFQVAVPELHARTWWRRPRPA